MGIFYDYCKSNIFHVFLMIWPVLCSFYLCGKLLFSSWSISWNYISGGDSDGVGSGEKKDPIRVLSKEEYAKYTWFQSLIYFITGWIFLIAIFF